MARQPQKQFREKDLTKGQLRKLNALRKSVGDGIAHETFAKWLRTQQQSPTFTPTNRNAELLAEAVEILRK